MPARTPGSATGARPGRRSRPFSARWATRAGSTTATYRFVSNESHVALGTAEHVLLAGLRWHRHRRDTLMYYPPGRASRLQPRVLPVALHAFGHADRAQPVPEGRRHRRRPYRHARRAVRPCRQYRRRPNDAPATTTPPPWPDMTTAASRRPDWSPGGSGRRREAWRCSPTPAAPWRAPVIDEQYEVQYAKSMCRAATGRCGPKRIVGLRAGAVLDFNDIEARGDKAWIRTTLFRNRGKHEIFQRRGVACRGRPRGGAASDCPKPFVQLPQPARLHHRRAGTGDLLRQPGDVRQPIAFGYARAPRRLAARSMGTAHLDRRDPAGLGARDAGRETAAPGHGPGMARRIRAPPGPSRRPTATRWPATGLAQDRRLRAARPVRKLATLACQRAWTCAWPPTTSSTGPIIPTWAKGYRARAAQHQAEHRPALLGMLLWRLCGVLLAQHQ